MNPLSSMKKIYAFLQKAAIVIAALALPASALASIPSLFKVTPGQGATVESVTTIVIEGQKDDYLYSYSETNTKITINGQQYSATAQTTSGYGEEDILTYTLVTPYAESGECEIVIPAESFYYGWNEYNNPEISWTLTVLDSSTPTPPSGFTPYEYDDCTIAPVQGTYGHLQKFVLSFTELYYVEANPYSSITLVDDATGQVVATTKGSDGTGAHDAIVSFPEPIKKAGNYTLVIPAGAFTDQYYDECGEYKFAYVVDGSEDDGGDDPDEFKPYEYDDVTVSPVQGTYGSLRTIDFKFADLFLVDGDPSKVITLVNDATGEVVASAPGEGGCGYTDAYVEFAEAVTAAGRYTLIVPQGAFYDVYDKENPEYKFAYVLDGSGNPIPEAPEDVAASPVSGSTVTKLAEIVLTFPESLETFPITSSYRPQGPIVVKNAAGEQVATGKVSRGSQHYRMLLAITEPITEAGEYTVVIPARNIVLEGDDVQRFNRTITLAYTVEPFKPIENKGVTINPAQGEVSALTSFTVSFTDIQMVDINGNFKAYLIDKASGEQVSTAKVRYGARTWDADIELETPVTAAGEYILVCEENLFYDGMTDEDFPEYRFAYIVDGSGTIPYNPEAIISDPAENVAVGQLDEIVLTFDDIDQVYMSRDVLENISVMDAEGNAVAACTFFYDSDVMSGNQVGIRLSAPVTADGTYTITLPRRAFTLGASMSDARFSNATMLTYLVDSTLSVGSVAVDADAPVRYFDLQGRAIQTPARGQVVIRLSAGKASKIRF